MMKGKKIVIIIAILLTNLTPSGLFDNEINVSASSGITIVVAKDGTGHFPTIQSAIDSASAGDTVFVRNGIYLENIIVNKPIVLVGENNEETVIDGGGSGYAVTISADGVIFENFNVTKGGQVWPYAAVSITSSQNTVSNNIISGSYFAMYLYFSDKNHIHNNTLYENMIGIILATSNNNHIMSNTDSDSFAGIYSIVSTANIISYNYLTGNGIVIEGEFLTHANTHTIVENFVNGRPVYYYANASGLKVPEDAGQVILANCNNMVVENINASDTVLGISLIYSENNYLGNNSLSGNTRGISLYNSEGNDIVNNTVYENSQSGIYIYMSNNNIIYHNNFINNGYGNAPTVDYGSSNQWHMNNQGNYWSSYTGVDDGSNSRVAGDGIGDTNLPHHGIDYYPFVEINGWILNLPETPQFITEDIFSSDGVYSIQWTSSEYAFNYVLYENNNILFEDITDTVIEITGKVNGTYVYTVKAININGISNHSDFITVIVNHPAWPPVSEILTESFRSIDGIYTINWTSTNYADYYILYENDITILNTTNTYHSFEKILDGEYSYKVQAFNSNASSLSNSVVINVEIAKTPEMPEIITEYMFNDTGDFIIIWNSSMYAESYILYENGQQIYSGNNLIFEITGRENGTYTYKVMAVNDNGTSSFSNEITVNVMIMGPQIPALPSFITGSQVSDINYIIEWQPSDYAEYYVLYENNTEVYNGTGTQATITGRNDGTYIYRVMAGNENGTSGLSGQIAIVVRNEVEEEKKSTPGFQLILLIVAVLAITIKKKRGVQDEKN